MLIQRSLAYSSVQNFDESVNDLNTCLGIDSTQVLAYWLRATSQMRMNEFQSSGGVDVQIKTARSLNDINQAIALSPQNPFLFYDRGNIHVTQKQYAEAIDDYTKALEIEPMLAEAYYNRGLARLFANLKEQAVADLSKAGELGLYDAYSVIKKEMNSKNKEQTQ